MSEYKPDRWLIVKISPTESPPIYKVLGSWYGGYSGSDSYRFSSGITKIKENTNHYEIDNHSGSKYICYKTAEGVSSYAYSVYMEFKEKLEDSNMGRMETINIKDIYNDFN